MIKQQAHYRVTVFTNKETVTVTDPLTCHFNVQRGVLCDSTKATIQLYNLAPSTREMIFQDAFTFDESQWKYVHLEAGYGDTMSMIFKGRILQAYSHKGGGQTDIVTEIQAQALDIFDCQCSYTFKAGTTFMDAYQTLASTLPNCKLTNVGVLEGEFKTDTTFDGNTYEQLQKLTGGNAFVDNGVLNCLNPNEVIDVPVPVISDSSALLETPMRRDANLEVKMLFEPTLIVGQLLEIQSSISPNFNGQFKVQGFTHDCVISGSEAGTRTTTVNLWIGPFLPGANINLTDNEGNSFAKVSGIGKVELVLSKIPEDARTTYNYIQKHNGKLPNTRITKQITWKDMLGHNNTDADRLKECTLEICANAWATAQRFQARVINPYFSGKTVRITSGWRSSRNNRSCKGAPKSRHLYGLAIDFVVNGLGVNVVAKKVASSGAWSYTIPEASWVHVQLNPSNNSSKRVNDK